LAAPDESPLTPLRTGQPPPEPGTLELDIDAQIARADIPALCERVRDLLERTDANRLVCDVGAILDPDAVTVDALARVQLTARRLGCQVRLEHASPQLRGLMAFMGLSGVVPISARSRLEAGRQTEQREEVGRVEKEADAADPIA
jgi:anti-anti-sigma regulatory factor